MVDTKKEKYRTCIQNITDGVFTEQNITHCLGENMEFFYYDIDYELYKIKGRFASKINTMVFDLCHKIAGLDREFAYGCDRFLTDTEDYIWNGFDFYNLATDNKLKYLETMGRIPEGVFNQMLGSLKVIKDEYQELVDSLNEQTDLAVMQIKNLIDLKIEQIV